MKLKTVDVNGQQYAALDANGLPVYVHDDGKEIGFDAAQAIGKIASLNAEAKSHREKGENFERQLSAFKGIDDPAKALDALAKLSKIDQKQLIDAGAVDQVRAEITASFQKQLDELTGTNKTLESQLYDAKIGGSFAASKFIAEKLAIPFDLVQARFGNQFKLEDGNVTAYDAQGNKVYSRSKPGEVAGFDEALEYLIESYPQKDYILKASGNNGGGSRQSQHQAGQKTIKRDAFDALAPADKMASMKDGVKIVD